MNYKIISPLTLDRLYSINEVISAEQLGGFKDLYLSNGSILAIEEPIVKEIKVEIPAEEPQSEEIQEEEINKTPLKVEIPETTSNPKNKK